MAQGRREEGMVVGRWPAGGQVRAACLKLSISQRNEECGILPCTCMRTLPCRFLRRNVMARSTVEHRSVAGCSDCASYCGGPVMSRCTHRTRFPGCSQARTCASSSTEGGEEVVVVAFR